MKNETLRIGRERGNQIVLASDSVSRRHCRIDLRKSGWFIKDLGSTNGTYVNDELVEEYQLRRGDQVKVGDTIFKYLSGQDVEAQYHETIYRMTIMDGLTNIHNQRYLLETLERELPRALRHQRPLSLCMFDLDHFKQVNDTYGHIAGDYVLKEVAGAVRGRLRPDDVLARYGGEEFVIILPDTTEEQGVQVMARVQRELTKNFFLHRNERILITFSAGVAQRVAGETAEVLLKRADAALYRAKHAGRNRVIGANLP
jgi:diguanylate cyclase (GGDEF)-like protein